jgi:hypothetical protein
MTEFDYEGRTPYARFADGGQPLYFRRRYGQETEPPVPPPFPGAVVVSLAPAEPITIYGYSYQSSYAEDRAHDPETWNRRRAFFAWCCSVMEPRGEPGYVPLDAVEEISREEFEAAAERGWR